MIYLDNAATSYPKPDEVSDSVYSYMRHKGGNPGRSGHRLSIEAGEIVFQARQLLADFFGIKNPMRVIFTFNATDALNIAIQGLLRSGGHVITTSMEHNSVIRPLSALEQSGLIELSIIQADKYGFVKGADIASFITKNTKLVIINHGSNAFGIVQPIAEIGLLCKEKNIPLLLDAAQTAGTIPIDMANDNISLLACAGHKALLGPPGTGALIIADSFDHKKITPFRYGGTGSLSDKLDQPDFLPDIFESGTLNTAGIAGLAAGIEFLNGYKGGLETVKAHKMSLAQKFMDAAQERIRGFTSYIPAKLNETGTVSFNIEGKSPSDVSLLLSENYDIMSRAGLHCAPLAHQTMKTFPQGTVRFGFGLFNTTSEIEQTVQALAEIAG